jgi:hypothetical protein
LFFSFSFAIVTVVKTTRLLLYAYRRAHEAREVKKKDDNGGEGQPRKGKRKKTRRMMDSLMHLAIRSLPSGSPRRSAGIGNQKQALLAGLLCFGGLSLAVQNPHSNFCRRWGHQTTVIDDKLYIDGGWVDYDDFPQTQKDYPSKSPPGSLGL